MKETNINEWDGDKSMNEGGVYRQKRWVRKKEITVMWEDLHVKWEKKIVREEICHI